MSIYHWLVILLVLFGFLMRGYRKGNMQYVILAMILMFCIQSLRDGETIGNDSRTSYRWQFLSMEETKWEDLRTIQDWWSLDTEGSTREGHERNFALPWLMKLVYEWGNGDYQWFLALISAIVLSALGVMIQRYSPSPMQSVLYYLGLLYFSFHMSATKQTVAMSIILLSFPAIIERKPIRFLALVLAASFFHFPAMIFLPAYWIANMKMGRNYLLLVAAVFVLTYVFRSRLVSIMTDAYSTEIKSSGGRFLANKVIVMLAIILAAFVVRPPDSGDRVYCAVLQLIVIAAVIQTFSGYNNTFERLADYYFQFAVIFIPMIFERVETKTRYLSSRSLNMICSYGPIMFSSFAIWRFLDNIMNDEHFFPFRFFFQ